MMNHPRPTSLRKTIQLMVVLTLLAWATQTLFKQWGYGAVILATDSGQSAQAPASRGASILELRDRINTDADVVRLRDVCRWSKDDAPAFQSLRDLVLVRLGNSAGVKKVTASDVRAALHDAGANLPMIQISGAAACAVVKGAVSEEQIARVMQTNDQAPVEAAPQEPKQQKAPEVVDTRGVPEVASTPRPPEQPLVENPQKSEEIPAASASLPAPELAEAPQISLKDLLVNDLTSRLGLANNQLQLQFDPRDETTLALTSPRLTFQIDSSRATGLGPVAWTITIKNGPSERTAKISARAGAWEDQVVLTRSLSIGQMIQKNDVKLRHELVEKLTPGKILDPSDAIGEVACRSLERGDVLSHDAVTAPSLVQAGDFVTISMTIDSMKIETVARALDSGPKGQTIRAKNEATGQVYQVSVTGPGTGDVIQTSGRQDVASINPGS